MRLRMIPIFYRLNRLWFWLEVADVNKFGFFLWNQSGRSRRQTWYGPFWRFGMVWMFYGLLDLRRFGLGFCLCFNVVLRWWHQDLSLWVLGLICRGFCRWWCEWRFIYWKKSVEEWFEPVTKNGRVFPTERTQTNSEHASWGKLFRMANSAIKWT